MQTSSMSDTLHTPKKEFQLAGQPSAVYPPSSYPDHCDLMAEAINCPLPVSVDAGLDASQSGQIGPENQSSSDICLGSESFLQSLEAIPLPSLGQNKTTLYNPPMSTYPDLYTNVSETKHLSCSSAAMQQEILQAWGSAGPPTNFNTSSGVGFVQMPFVPGENPVAPPRCVPRAIRSRGRGRGLRRQQRTPSHVQSRVGPSSQTAAFSPRCRPPPVAQTSVRAETVTTSASQSYLTAMSNQLPPPQNQVNGSLPRDAAAPSRQTCNRQSSETVLNSEETQANEKMNAYIEKFSSESCEMFGPLISVDTSRKPSTLQEAISMYIDFIVLENEKRTRISCCNVLPMPLDFHKEDYYHEIMCQPIAFPTPKFRDWLKLYNVDIEITDPDGQTVSQTTFPPSANFSDTRVSIPTSLHMINWQQTRGIATNHPQGLVAMSPRLNLPGGVLRGRPKSRTIAGQAVRFGHPGIKGVAGHPPFEFMQNSPADRAANVRFLRGSMTNCGSTHPASPCGGVMHQFQTISLPALGSIQYFGQGPMPTNIPRPCPEVSTNSNSLQMISSFQGTASAHSSNYYRMGPLFNPYPNEMAWRNCCSRPPNALLSDPKTNAFSAEMDAENMAAYMNRPDTMTSSDSAMLGPSVMSMLPPFSSFANGSSGAANPPNESVKCYLPVQSSSESSCSKTGQNGEPAAVSDQVQALNFVREPERPDRVSSLPSSVVGRSGCLSAGDASASAAGFNWNDAKNYSRPGSAPVIKEMVDQGSQTEIDKAIAEEEEVQKADNGETGMMQEEEEDQTKEGEFGLDSSICCFSCSNDGFDEGRKTEDQLNSEILLRNASLILNGSMEEEADESSTQATGFASQEDIGSSQASTLGDLDGLALSGACDGEGIHSFMTVSLTCSSEDPPKATTSSEEMRSSSGDDDCCNKADGEYDDETTVAEGGVQLMNKSSDLLLEVGSNVEINTDGIATVGERGSAADYRYWMEPRRKRARFSRVGNRQGVTVGRDRWSNACTARAQRKQQQQQTFIDQSAVSAIAFEDGDESVRDGDL